MMKVVILVNKSQKEVQQAHLNAEKHLIKLLERVYGQARNDCEKKIMELSSRTDLENLQSIIYQKQYQEALKKQLEGILDNLQSEEFTSIADYLQKSYHDGYVGVMYDLTKQGIPLIIPINQEQVVKALQTDSKLSKGLYARLGEDVNYLKRSIRAELSRGIANGSTWNEIAGKIAKGMNSPFNKSYNRAILIARTEGHRIQQRSTLDGQFAAKEKGADVLKQWDSTLDRRTRPHHRQLDGQIRELEEDFEVDGLKAQAPGHFGKPKEDCNCRCCLLQRARWALDEYELNELKERAAYFGLDKTKDFEEFKQKYLKTIEDPVVQLKKYEDDFMELTDGYSYDDFMNDFGSIEEGFDGASHKEILVAKELDEKIKFLRNQMYNSVGKIPTTKESIEKFKNIGIEFKDNSTGGISDTILNKFANFVTNFEYNHAGFFVKNKHKLKSINIVDKLNIKGVSAAGAYDTKLQSITLMKKSIETKSKSKLITYSKSDDFQLHFLSHEYGHYVADVLEKTYEITDYDIVQNAMLKYFDDFFDAKTSNLIDELGSYGSTNAREAFAEAFAEAYTCENPCDFVKIFKEELETTIKNLNNKQH